MRIISEADFSDRIRGLLLGNNGKMATAYADVGSVTGPGRSGAIASVYASHILGVPFVPYKANVPSHLGRLLIIDTATESGATLRKAGRWYNCSPHIILACYHEPPRVAFWYESSKPQHYRHERLAA